MFLQLHPLFLKRIELLAQEAKQVKETCPASLSEISTEDDVHKMEEVC